MGLDFRGQRLVMLPTQNTIIVGTNRLDTQLRGVDGNDLNPRLHEWFVPGG
jgi:hypothetical protein